MISERPVDAASPDASLGEVLDFLRLLWAVDHGLQRASKRMESSFGVTGPQRVVLRIVGRFPDISAGRVAGILHLHPSTLTGILQRLEEHGLLQRKADTRDGRRALFSLTVKGKRAQVLRAGMVEHAVTRVLKKAPGKLAAARDVLSLLALELAPEND